MKRVRVRIPYEYRTDKIGRNEDCGGICQICGQSHARPRRRALAARLAAQGIDPETIQDAYPCLWPPGPAGYRRLRRDVAAAAKERT
jgi:hypothetical protein